MLDVLCTPVSAILWCWHSLLGTVLDPFGGVSWALAIVLLVFTLRALLVPLALRQLRATRALRAARPGIAALRDRHRDDPRRLATELSAYYRSEGIRPAGAFLPALAQAPVFLGLLHVLHGFSRPGGPGVFDAAGVSAFLHARLLSAPLVSWVRMPADRLAALGVDRWQVAAVAVPLAALAAVATYLTTRHSLGRQDPPADAQARVVNAVLLYGLPASALAGALVFALPVGILLYWLATNLWTLGQQAVLHRVVDER